MNKLQQLQKMTTVVADTGDIDAIKQYMPTDATTNPSLIYKAAQLPQYKELVYSAVAYGKAKGQTVETQADLTLDKLAVNIGKEILNIIPGRVSTEVDARLSFNTEATIKKAEHLISMYNNEGINQQRILIKIAATWEGIKAAQQLEKKGIHCNLTLIFNIAQAVAAAEAGVTLISPFVGRIFDWHKKADGVETYPAYQDPGVVSVKAIYNYFKKFNHNTTVMGASFRNVDEILALAGCDLLTIAPALMEELQGSDEEVCRELNPETSKAMDIHKIDASEASFRWLMNEDAMATEKLAEGIRNFTLDTLKLEQYVQENTAHRAA